MVSMTTWDSILNRLSHLSQVYDLVLKFYQNIACVQFIQKNSLTVTFTTNKSHHPSCCINGLAMASMPSAGHIKTTDVPRHTTKPSCRVSSVSLYGSSGSEKQKDMLKALIYLLPKTFIFRDLVTCLDEFWTHPFLIGTLEIFQIFDS